MKTLLKYMLIREYPNEGKKGTRPKALYRWSDDEQLKVGGLYFNLGHGFPGYQRVLCVVSVKTSIDID